MVEAVTLVTKEAGEAAVKQRGQEGSHLDIPPAQPRPLDPGLQKPQVTLGEDRAQASWPAADRGWT